MRKHIIYSLALLLAAGVASISCSKESVENVQENTGLKTYSVTVSADKAATKVVGADGTAEFTVGDKIYVAKNNGTKKYDIAQGYLSAEARGVKARLSGNLEGNFSVKDKLILMYGSDDKGIVDYNDQDGRLIGVKDAATATVEVTSIEPVSRTEYSLTTTPANFENLQSVFEFTFKKNGKAVFVQSLTVISQGNYLVQSYNIATGENTFGPVTVKQAAAKESITVALRFKYPDTPVIDDLKDEITFVVTDGNGTVYRVTKDKAAPGFAMNKFYKSTIAINQLPYSVSDDLTVDISSGNLVYDPNTRAYSFEPEPYPYEYDRDQFAGYGYNSDLAELKSKTSYHSWGTVVNRDGTPRLFSIDNIDNWRTLTSDEWTYLANYRAERGKLASGVASSYAVVDKNGKIGTLFVPDDTNPKEVSGLNNGAWTFDVNVDEFLKRGFAFLPTEGVYADCYDGWAYLGLIGQYWSSTRVSDDDVYSFLMKDTEGYVEVTSIKTTFYASIRLFHE